MVRKFLFGIGFAVVLVILALLAFRLFPLQIMRAAFVPSADFIAQPPRTAATYADKKLWLARPDLPNNPSNWQPAGYKDTGPHGTAAIFYIHPTSYINRSAWNAPADDADANARAAEFVKMQASALSSAGQVWAPRYRQATFGTFITQGPTRDRALAAAYADVLAAWDAFLAAIPADQPIILAGHSQGSLHLMHLLHDRIAGHPVAARVVAAYVVGWPVSVTADLPSLGLPACLTAGQSGCILSWQSFAEPADTDFLFKSYAETPGLTGQPRRGTPMLCTNPLAGTAGGTAPASANHGSIFPSYDLEDGTLNVGLIPARCDQSGFLMIGEPPDGIGHHVLPGNNYHVFDYSLFWVNIRADAARRLAAFRLK